MPSDHTTHSDTSSPSGNARVPTVLAYIVMAVAATGYFIGVTAPMHPEPSPGTVEEVLGRHDTSGVEHGAVVPATSYSDMPQVARVANKGWDTRLDSLQQLPYDPFAEVRLSMQDKLQSLAQREQLRAFNGAPPVVPHPIDQYTSRGCLACHEEGLRSRTLRAAKMPHPFYSNCTQCHVESRGAMAAATLQVPNEFHGLPAPEAGPRAFPGAPPLIPHSVWMREGCLSCHGRTAAPGMETTHPWRQNCQQCHVPQARLNQVPFAEAAEFLPPPYTGEVDE